MLTTQQKFRSFLLLYNLQNRIAVGLGSTYLSIVEPLDFLFGLDKKASLIMNMNSFCRMTRLNISSCQNPSCFILMLNKDILEIVFWWTW